MTKLQFHDHYLNAAKAFLIAATLLLGSVNVMGADTEHNASRQSVADWSLSDPSGQKIDFYKHAQGASSVLFFWASWCPYCKALIPHLERFRAERGDENMRYYALNVWEDADPVQYAREKDFNFHLLLDADRVAEQYGVKGTPGVILVNPSQEVIYVRPSGVTPEQVITDMKFALENEASLDK